MKKHYGKFKYLFTTVTVVTMLAGVNAEEVQAEEPTPIEDVGGILDLDGNVTLDVLIIEDNATAVTEETRTEEVAFEIEYVNNSEMLVGTEVVSQEGVNGERTIVEEVTRVGGEETNREELSNEVTTAPVNKVIQVGTKAAVIEDNATAVTEETRTEEVAFEIEYVNNSEMLVGTEVVSQEGVLGERTIVEEVTRVGGEETKREELSNEVTTAPVNKVIQVGTKALVIEDNAKSVTEETRTEEVAFEIEYVNNSEMLVGTEFVSQEGVTGERTIVEEVTRIGGEETNREELSNEVTTAPVNKVVQVGTKAAVIEDNAKSVTEETRTEEVAFEIEYVNDPELLAGTEVVSQEGVNGERTIVEEVTRVGGEETKREELSNEITKAAVNKVIRVGTKAAVIEDNAKSVTEETRTEEVGFKIEYINNPELPVGTEVVSQGGVNGKRTIVEKVTRIGGEETDREELSNEITTAPVNKVVQVGTKAVVIEDNAKTVTEETRTEEVAFEIEYVLNATLTLGTEEVSQEGVNGERTIVEKVTRVGGEETDREEISNEITTSPVNKVIQIGTKAPSGELHDEDTGIIVEVGEEDEDLRLVAVPVTTLPTDPEALTQLAKLGELYDLYDIYLVNADNEKVSPTKPVTVRIPYYESKTPLKLFHFGDNYELMNEIPFTDHGNYVEFTFEDFSYFALQFATETPAEVTPDPTVPEKPTEVEKPTEGKKDKKHDHGHKHGRHGYRHKEVSTAGVLPKTGAASSITGLLGMLAIGIGSALGFKKKKK